MHIDLSQLTSDVIGIGGPLLGLAVILLGLEMAISMVGGWFEGRREKTDRYGYRESWDFDDEGGASSYKSKDL